MPKLVYLDKRFSAASQEIIEQANEILEEYAQQGFDLTLRQLYYQFVARGLMPSSQRSYNRLGSIIMDGRMAGLIDWDHIIDRTRWLRSVPHWGEPSDIIKSAASSFRIDKWEGQPYRCEVWIEKDALVGVIEGICRDLDVPYYACRGYASGGRGGMWDAAQRLMGYMEKGQQVRVFHLGDHDPSGIDMTRDIKDRLFTFFINDHYRNARYESREAEAQDSIDWVRQNFSVERLALNMDQVEQYDPPPFWAKITDSRAAGYIAEFGEESWELDALEPTVLAALISDAVHQYRDEELWDVAVAEEERHRAQLWQTSARWMDVVNLIDQEEE